MGNGNAEDEIAFESAGNYGYPVVMTRLEDFVERESSVGEESEVVIAR